MTDNNPGVVNDKSNDPLHPKADLPRWLQGLASIPAIDKKSINKLDIDTASEPSQNQASDEVGWIKEHSIKDDESTEPLQVETILPTQEIKYQDTPESSSSNSSSDGVLPDASDSGSDSLSELAHIMPNSERANITTIDEDIRAKRSISYQLPENGILTDEVSDENLDFFSDQNEELQISDFMMQTISNAPKTDAVPIPEIDTQSPQQDQPLTVTDENMVGLDEELPEWLKKVIHSSEEKETHKITLPEQKHISKNTLARDLNSFDMNNYRKIQIDNILSAVNAQTEEDKKGDDIDSALHSESSISCSLLKTKPIFIEILGYTDDQRINKPIETIDPQLETLRQALLKDDIQEVINKANDLITQETFLDNVINMLQGWLENHPESHEIWQLLGDAFMHNDQAVKAVEAYTKSSELFS